MTDRPLELSRCLSQSRRTLWFGAQSFEERCIGSLLALQQSHLSLSSAVIVKYNTNVKPAREAEERTSKYWKIINSFKAKLFPQGVTRLTVEPYSFHDAQETFLQVLDEHEPDCVILDITCLTKVHTLALAASLAEAERPIKYIVAYSTPENYTHVPKGKKSTGTLQPGWRDVIVAPLADTALLFNEAHSRGVIIIGHEADRLVVGLAELEPSGGVILKTFDPRRPDLHRASDNYNKKIVRQLTSMQASRWTTKLIVFSDLKKFEALLQDEIDSAKKYDAPVILFPYGPKLLTFIAGNKLAIQYPQASWFVYPIPSLYPVNYTEGIEKTLWLLPDAQFHETGIVQSHLLSIIEETSLASSEYVQVSE